MDDGPAIIALGANLPSPFGPPLASLRITLDRLAKLSREPIRFSAPYASPAVGCEPGAPDFVNAVALLTPPPQSTANTLLRDLQQMEAEFGRRQRQSGHESRPLDLDLIAYAEQVLCTPELVLPHPRAAARAFVLLPLAELLPRLVLPGQELSVQQLLAKLPGAGRELQRLSWD
ncbi:MAG: 2-amino-4-hydroxy-6-hydroxymethyldihydropteridine diphosphokinase [Gammaproteobacteria bacterium]